ncbi:hypothetical protein O181_119197 [Austropuccinia psidii MF-1]|uniref:DEAD-box helicase OB fold domain-containing protein n=1 Tax=Austropuccinia psidii MF-1 TaxID=1389203 RepID=A0A9Q3KGS7_9BASI|nr:hypothetical protein [Austropuccinia psidii MF-1]
MLVAARVDDKKGVRVGDAFGDSIPFECCTSQKTVIEYITDRMLLREIMTELDLAGYAGMIIDESHACTFSTEILLGLVKVVFIHPSSSCFQLQPPPKMVLFYELVLTSKEYARQAMQLDKPEWLLQAAPHFFKPADLEIL